VAELKFASEYFALARERERIRRKRLAGEPPPWTDDQILREWRFTNVHREHDKTTVWFRENIRSQLKGRAVVEATIIFRWFNRVETGVIVKDLLLNGWDRAKAERRLLDVHPLITGAYMIKSPPGVSKLKGLLDCIDEARRLLPATPQWASLEEAWTALLPIPYLGPFLCHEVVTDLRWTTVLSHATDINTWSNCGPGATRGVGCVVDGNPYRYNRGSQAHQAEMLEAMVQLLEMSWQEAYWSQAWDPWELHEVEMWACEWAKYQSAQAGNRLKRKYAYTPSS
jgi:hypothetical protein